MGEATRDLPDSRRTELRANAIGFVFQFHHLIQAFTALENVLMPLMVRQGRPTEEQRSFALGLLKQVGLAGKEDRKPDQRLSEQCDRIITLADGYLESDRNICSHSINSS